MKRLNFICTLPNLAEKPLSVIGPKVKATLKDDWDGHAFGVCVGRILDDNTVESMINDDRDTNTTVIFDQLRNDYELIQKDRTYLDKTSGKLRTAQAYYVPYKPENHCSDLPTVMGAFVDRCSNVKYDMTYELLFVLEESYRRYVTVSYHTEGTYASTFYDQLSELEDMIEEWIDEEKHGIHKIKEYNAFTMPFYNDIGERNNIEFANKWELLQSLASIRVIRCDQTIIEPETIKEEETEE